MKFIFPEKPERIFDINTVPDNYFFQVKKDGHRCEIIISDNGVEIFNRYGKPLNAIKNDNWEWLKNIFPSNTILDGEVVGARQKGEVNDTIVVWDCPFFDNKDLTNSSYIERYDELKKYSNQNILELNNKKVFGTTFIGANNNLKIYLSSNFDKKEYYKYWKSLDGYFDEGLVFKNPKAKLAWNYRAGKTSVNQLKKLLTDEKGRNILTN